MTDYTVNDVYAALNLFKDYIQANLPYKLTGYKGIVDPSVSGFGANIPAVYTQVDAIGPNEVLLGTYYKSGPLSTDWTIIDTGVDSGIWHLGTGVPSGGLGSNNDWYFDNAGSAPHAIYYKTGGSWVQKTIGTQWLTGTAVPTAEGIDDDWYIRTGAVQELYLKVTGSWVLKVSISANGTTWLQGAPVPTTEGVDGNYYLRTGADQVYYKAAGTWSLVLSGGGGTTWLQGASVPTTEGIDGNYYLRLGTDTIYFKAAGTWSLVMSGGGGGGPATAITFNNVPSGLAATDVQAAIDEIAPLITDVTWTVGVGGDYPNLAQALNAYLARPTLRSVQVTLLIMTGHVLTVADQISINNTECRNLIIETQDPSTAASVDASGFLANSLDPTRASLITLTGAMLGSIRGRFQVTVPHATRKSVGVFLFEAETAIYQYPPAPNAVEFIDFDSAIYAVYGHAFNLYSNITNSGVNLVYGQSLTFLQCPVANFARSGKPQFDVDYESELYLTQCTITSNSSLPTSIFKISSGSTAEVIGGSISAGCPVALVYYRSKLSIVPGITIDQTLLAANGGYLFSVTSGSDLEISGLLTITNPNNSARFLNIDAKSKLTVDSPMSINSTEWAEVCNLPIGQTFADGGGIYGPLLVDGSQTGLKAFTVLSGDSVVRPPYSSELRITSVATTLASLSIYGLGSLPGGAKIKILCTQDITTLSLPDVGKTITNVRAMDVIVVEYSALNSGQVIVHRENIADTPVIPTPIPVVVAGNITATASWSGRPVLVTAAAVITLPQASTEDLVVGFPFDVFRGTSGAVSFAVEGSDVIVATVTGPLVGITDQYGWCSVMKTSAGVWSIVGQISDTTP